MSDNNKTLITKIAHTNKWFDEWVTKAWCSRELRLGGLSLKGEAMYWYEGKYLTHTNLYLLKMNEPLQKNNK